jgi:hypothetical protein
MKVVACGGGENLSYRQLGPDLMVKAPAKLPGQYAMALKMTPLPWQVARD